MGFALTTVKVVANPHLRFCHSDVLVVEAEAASLEAGNPVVAAG